jgi:hypothetical protein
MVKKIHKPPVVIAEIKRVWRPGMSSKDVAAAFNPEVVTLQHDAVAQYFRKWRKELEPCYLPLAVRKPKYKLPAVVEETFEPDPKPRPLRETYVNENGITLPKVFRDRR